MDFIWYYYIIMSSKLLHFQCRNRNGNGILCVNSALVCTQKGRRDGNSNSDEEKRGGKKIFLLSFLPPNF
jgi:hypothetical protein